MAFLTSVSRKRLPDNLTNEGISVKFGILLSTHPDKGDGPIVRHLVDEAGKAGDTVYLYLLDEGTRFILEEWVQDLPSRSVHVYSCAYGAQSRRINDPGKTTFCGLVMLTQIMEGSDRFVSFN